MSGQQTVAPATNEGPIRDRIEVLQVTKRFPGVKSLDAVSFGVRAGEIHALVGENGAGKSTLMKVMAGAYLPDEGEIRFVAAGAVRIPCSLSFCEHCHKRNLARWRMGIHPWFFHRRANG